MTERIPQQPKEGFLGRDKVQLGIREHVLAGIRIALRDAVFLPEGKTVDPKNISFPPTTIDGYKADETNDVLREAGLRSCPQVIYVKNPEHAKPNAGRILFFGEKRSMGSLLRLHLQDGNFGSWENLTLKLEKVDGNGNSVFTVKETDD